MVWSLQNIKTIFVAGVYGVDKEYLCNKISNFYGIKKFSASQLISNINNENYVKNKSVKNIGSKSKIIDLVYDNSDVSRFQKFLEE